MGYIRALAVLYLLFTGALELGDRDRADRAQRHGHGPRAFVAQDGAAIIPGG